MPHKAAALDEGRLGRRDATRLFFCNGEQNFETTVSIATSQNSTSALAHSYVHIRWHDDKVFLMFFSSLEEKQSD